MLQPPREKNVLTPAEVGALEPEVRAARRRYREEVEAEIWQCQLWKQENWAWAMKRRFGPSWRQ